MDKLGADAHFVQSLELFRLREPVRYDKASMYIATYMDCVCVLN